MANIKQDSKVSDSKTVFRTSLFEHTYDFKWEVEDFPKWQANTTMKTPIFHPELERDFSADLEKLSDGYCHLSFFLDSGPDIQIEHHASVTDANGSKPTTVLSAFVPDKNHLYQHSTNKPCIFSFYVKELEDFCNASNTDLLVFNCTMKTIRLETESVSSDQETVASEDVDRPSKFVCPQLTDNLSILVDNLKNMFINSKDTDVTLNVGDQSLTAHRAILKARSPFFGNLLNETPDALTINNIEMPVLEDLLKFFYTGKLDNDDFDSVFLLYDAAYEYEVPSLLETCASILLSKLNIKNACRLLSLADSHHDTYFRGLVMDFVQLHYSEVVDTEEWDKFVDKNFRLANKIFLKQVSRSKCK